MTDSDDSEETDDRHAADTTDTELVPSTEKPDDGREHIEMLRETIDRNRGHGWEHYRERYRFTIVDDGTVRISKRGSNADSERAVETAVDHVVTVEAGVAVGCNCFMAGRRFTSERCRHMRAVDTHPRL